ncbi:peptide ABC transporter ATP-binding protein [Candidatus Epulonipiscium fishelsonii]|uniref:Peptide ABC transporter ATP-binding protein n=1 Tax=Candidatus Epulonipiscium fishelsonii TaxID=77094 RepID=A0ACC8XAQ9_9FIRM|nr:peptide ABC transporter ATP-binding protein [Epulopiscium sp. SCG-B05WGA-EpuloA1]ONI39616.1 peptide ABC transporter ATP-binding protein [Epulopiscium sp. SCG-B11WGA-EpuloA1]
MKKMVLEIDNLKVSFFNSNGEVQAVRGVTFGVNEGEILGIVGESGSGKSVTSMSILRLLAESAKLKEGSIKFEGKELTTLTKKEMQSIRGKDISMIFQDPMSSLNPLHTIGNQVAEMIAVHNTNLSKKEVKQRVLQLFEKIRIPEPEKRYNMYPHQFSGGMRQRIMIAIALANAPRLLIADEPTTALDVTIQDQILKLLRDLQKDSNTSIVFITHDLGVVAELCHRVVVLYGGLVMEEGLVDDIFENPKHPYTLGLMASMPEVNQDKSIRLQSIKGSPPDMTNPPLGCPFAPRCNYARKMCAAELPPYVEVGNKHRSMCWLLTQGAPSEHNPFK